MDAESTAMHAAAILNAAYLVRLYGRPGQVRARSRALEHLARAAERALAARAPPEPVLYAIAAGLYDRRDPRFC